MPVSVWIGSLSVVLAAPVLVWALAAQRQVVRSRHGRLMAPTTNLREMQLAQSAVDRAVWPLLHVVARRVRAFTPAGLVRSLEHQIQLAGGTWPVERVLALKLVMAGVIAVPGALSLVSGVTMRSAAGLVLLTGVMYLLPDIVLVHRAGQRQQRIAIELPDTLDQITISVEAGLGFEAAMARTGRNGSGPLSEELVRTLQDIQIGIPRRQALKNLLARTNVPELRHFVVAMVQAEGFGVPIAQVLRVQSTEMREKRRQRAEEAAMKVPVKVVMPLVFCILPTLLLVVMGPAALRIAHNFNF